MASPLRTGLVSVTFRDRSVEQIVDDVVAADLDGIEWGGDVHVPPGNLNIAADARRRTVAEGLAVTAYGSYYSAAKNPPGDIDAVLATAAELGAPTVRIWAGPVGSAAADESTFARVADDIVRVAGLAEAYGLSITLEYHGGTLTDTLPSTLKLLDRIGRDDVVTGWQPRDGLTAAAGVDEIRQIGPRLGNVHVFQWKSWTDRQPLADGAERWAAYFNAATADGRRRYAMLEFVANDDIEQFKRDAATLKTLLG